MKAQMVRSKKNPGAWLYRDDKEYKIGDTVVRPDTGGTDTISVVLMTPRNPGDTYLYALASEDTLARGQKVDNMQESMAFKFCPHCGGKLI